MALSLMLAATTPWSRRGSRPRPRATGKPMLVLFNEVLG